MVRRGRGNARHEPRYEELGIHAMDGLGERLNVDAFQYAKGTRQEESEENTAIEIMWSIFSLYA
jgi:hypothetical protein